MASLNIQSFATMVSNQAASIQSRASSLVDFSVGSILRSLTESTAGVALWLQGLVLHLLAVTRLATSNGSDVDSFVNDFSLTRIGGNASAGSVTFGRYSALSSSMIPVGATVQTLDGTQNFTIIADPTNGAYSASLSSYVVAAGVSTMTVLATCSTVGASGHVAANSISVMTTAIAGVDYVNNSSAFTGGASAETDSALKARFVLYILGLARGNHYGLAAAIANTNLVVQYTLTENYTYSGAYSPGSFYVVADDGTGSPSTTFLSGISAAVQTICPLGVQAYVFAPTITYANASMTITTATGYTHSTVVGAVGALITANINAIGLGNGLAFYDLAAWAFSVPGVTNVSAVLLNSSSGDSATIAANPQATIKAGTITIA